LSPTGTKHALCNRDQSHTGQHEVEGCWFPGLFNLFQLQKEVDFKCVALPHPATRILYRRWGIADSVFPNVALSHSRCFWLCARKFAEGIVIQASCRAFAAGESRSSLVSLVRSALRDGHIGPVAPKLDLLMEKATTDPAWNTTTAASSKETVCAAAAAIQAPQAPAPKVAKAQVPAAKAAAKAPALPAAKANK
jgi:hypothetical protein